MAHHRVIRVGSTHQDSSLGHGLLARVPPRILARGGDAAPPGPAPRAQADEPAPAANARATPFSLPEATSLTADDRRVGLLEESPGGRTTLNTGRTHVRPVRSAEGSRSAPRRSDSMPPAALQRRDSRACDRVVETSTDDGHDGLGAAAKHSYGIRTPADAQAGDPGRHSARRGATIRPALQRSARSPGTVGPTVACQSTRGGTLACISSCPQT